MRLKPLLCLAVLGAAASLWSACSKSSITLDLGGGTQQGGGEGSPDGATLVTFHASIESRNITRSLSALSKDIRADLFAFDGGAAGASQTPVAQGAYVSAVPGTLQGVAGYRMRLPAGTYDFYGVSANDSFAPPAFNGGVSEQLQNGFDYLWWRGLQQEVSSQQAAIPIVFLHCGTQVVFRIAEGEGVSIDALELAHLYPPIEGARMTLSTGEIPPAVSFGTQIAKMGVNGLLAQYTMLPVRTTQPMQVSFDVRINGEVTPRTYSVAVPLPDGELRAGDSYRFEAVIRGDEVSLASVSVAGWTDVDETGKPLYPLQ